MFVVQGVEICATNDILIHIMSPTPQDKHTQHKYSDTSANEDNSFRNHIR